MKIKLWNGWFLHMWRPEKINRKWEPHPHFSVIFGKTYGIRLWYVNIAVTKAITRSDLNDNKIYDVLLIDERKVAGIKWRKFSPRNCPVIERDGDGKSVGTCWFYLDKGVCPRHGRIYGERK